MNTKKIEILSVLLPFAIFGLFESMFLWPVNIYWFFVSGLALIFVTILIFCYSNAVERSWWNFLILPSLLFLSVFSYSTLLAPIWLIQTVFITAGVCIYLYIRTIFFYLLRPSRYKTSSIEYVSSYVSLFSFFLLTSSLFGFQSFLGLSDWISILLAAIFNYLFFYQVFWSAKIGTSKNVAYQLILTIVSIEIFWGVSLLPFYFQISGVIVSLVYYALSNLAKLDLLNRLTAEKIRHYVFFLIISIGLILLSARWL